MNLYALTVEMNKIQAWFDKAEDNPALLTEDFYKELDAVTEARDKKLEGCRKILANYEAQIEGIGAEIQRLENLQKPYKARYESLKNWVSQNLQPGEKFECSIGGFSWKESSYLDSAENATIPKAYQRVKIEPDKLAIKAAINAGKKIKGWFIATRQNLQVK